MRALVYDGFNSVSLREKPFPLLASPTDAIVKVTKTTICGTDLHIRKSDVATCQPGRTLGHEGAEHVRIPHADSSLYPIPDGADDDDAALVMLSDVFPTGLECGVLNGKVQPGGTVVIVGSGPVGLAAVITAQMYSPSQVVAIEVDVKRLEVARRLGATDTINSAETDAVAQVKALTEGKGADAVIEAVGVPATFDLCQSLLAPGGVLANVGVHGTKVDLHLQNLWDKNIAITTRLVDTTTTPMLLKLVQSGKLKPSLLITHHFKLGDVEKAYETFGDASKHGTLKVVINVD
ncbi:alcohol dehydrogenase [Colletotrichum tanaceti]|uniref:Alcohol dehydrogenase n=1 Tax=Colletotrichum tanaceti TaxID=1306861 RepID=A0A4U6X0J0_9PEZI|nr:alcohol dehydrogenase [Colletotrichum tanaceti]